MEFFIPTDGASSSKLRRYYNGSYFGLSTHYQSAFWRNKTGTGKHFPEPAKNTSTDDECC